MEKERAEMSQMSEDSRRNTEHRCPTGGFRSLLRGTDWQRAASVTVCLAAALLGAWILVRYATGVVLPFLLAWLLSRPIRPVVKAVTGKTRLPRWLVAGFLVLLFVGLCGWGLAAGVRRAVTELGELIGRLGAETADAGALGQAMDWVYSLSEHLPILRRFEERPGFTEFCLWLDGAVRSAVSRAVGKVSEHLSAFLMGLFSGLPAVFLFLIVLLMSCYFFSADDGRLRAGITAHLPGWLRERLPRWQEAIGAFARRWLRAYLILMLITFTEMFIGLSVLRVPYAFLLAMAIAVVDFLPVFGSGTVLIPWAIVSFLSGNLHLGFGLAVLYGISLIVHEVCEPRLLGKSLGIHPLLSLFTMYAGLRLFGVGGMILAPVVAAGVVSAMKNKGDREGESRSEREGEHEGRGQSENERLGEGIRKDKKKKAP